VQSLRMIQEMATGHTFQHFRVDENVRASTCNGHKRVPESKLHCSTDGATCSLLSSANILHKKAIPLCPGSTLLVKRLTCSRSVTGR
jgi:hypothetical protein